MKKYICMVFFALCLCTVVYAQDEETSKIINEYIKIYGEELTDGINTVEQKDMELLIPDFSVEELLTKTAKGEPTFSVWGIISRLLSLLLEEIRRTAKLLAILPALAVLSSYITGMHDNFQMKGATNAAFFVVYVVMSGVSATAFIETVRCGQNIVENVAVFMRVLIPVSLAGLATSGAVISATSFEIVLMAVIEITELAVEKLFIPLVMMAAALNVVNNVSQSLNAEKIVQLINKLAKWGLGIMLTLFVGITGLQGIASGSADGLTVKVTKFAASNLIPMVGGILAETVETVMNCSVVIKNAVGVVGIITVIAIAVIPILKVAACLIVFRICAAIIQPISDARCTKCITELGDSVSAVLGMAAAVVVMFVIILTIVINIGNAAVMFGR